MNLIFGNKDTTFGVEEDFNKIRIIRKPKFHVEIINETSYDCSQRKYEINFYSVTLDTITGSKKKIAIIKKCISILNGYI